MVRAGGTRTCVHPHVSRPLYHCATDADVFVYVGLYEALFQQMCFHCKYSQLNDTTLNLKTFLHYPYHIFTSQFAPTIWLPNRINCFGHICVLTDSCTVRLLCVIYEDITLIGSHVRHLACKSSHQRINWWFSIVVLPV